MSRILVVTSGLSFGAGGHLVIARSLVQALREAGHRAEVRVTPQNPFGHQASAYLSTWLTDVRTAQDGGPVDQVVSFRYPSYAVRHPRHVCWLNHRMREYYDLWDSFHATLTPAQQAQRRAGTVALRRLLGDMEERNMKEAHAVNPELFRQLVGDACHARHGLTLT